MSTRTAPTSCQVTAWAPRGVAMAAWRCGRVVPVRPGHGWPPAHDDARTRPAALASEERRSRSGRRAAGAPRRLTTHRARPVMRHTATVRRSTWTLIATCPDGGHGRGIIGAPSRDRWPRRPTMPELGWEVVSRRPHDAQAWTQGLQLDDAGRLFESTGLLGRSTLREVDPQTGAVLRSVALPERPVRGGSCERGRPAHPAHLEGRRRRTWDAATFAGAGARIRYAGEGWGLCFDGQRLVMSDGSDRLTFRDAATFDRLARWRWSTSLPALRLNELECVDETGLGQRLADRYDRAHRPRVGADPTGLLDLSPLRAARRRGGRWLGRPQRHRLGRVERAPILVTGKLWSALFEIRIGADRTEEPAATEAGPGRRNSRDRRRRLAGERDPR